MNEAAEEREEEAVKGKKKRGAAARAESKPKRKRIQVRNNRNCIPGMVCQALVCREAVLEARKAPNNTPRTIDKMITSYRRPLL